MKRIQANPSEIDEAIKKRRLNHASRVPVLGGTRNIDADVIKKLVDEYNYHAAGKGVAVLCMDALALENTSVFRMERFISRYFVDKPYNFMTARYVFIPVNTKAGTHWEIMLVDLSKREIFVLDPLEKYNTIVSYHAYAEKTLTRRKSTTILA